MDAVKIQRDFVEENDVKNFHTAENSAGRKIIPEGYMTGKKFWRLIREDISKFYKESGFIIIKKL